MNAETAATRADTATSQAKKWPAWLNERAILVGLFRLLLITTVGFLALDFRTIYQEVNVPLPGETHRKEPMVMDPPKPKDHLRPYLPRATPVRRRGKPPKMPGYAKPPGHELIGEKMRFVRGPKGTASAVGRIEPGTALEFTEFLDGQGDEIKSLYLHSPGGAVADALTMSKLVREKKITTVVPAGAYCASSCPIVLSGGNERTVGKGAWVGVHQIFAARQTPGNLDDGMAQAQAVTAAVQEHLAKMGVDTGVWLHAMKTPSDQLYILTPKELKEYKLATKVAGR
ncbi:MAG: ATP-dependent Clp protease proteolytic subunit [Filomicrobium sp.]